MNRTLTKRKSETDVIDAYPPLNKRLLTERIAAGMGVLRLNDVPQDAQGNTRPPFIRTTSTPSAFYNGPAFTPARPDLVSSFEFTRQSMDEDLDMACDTPPLSTPNQQNLSSQLPPAPSNYTQPPHLLNNAPLSQYAIIPVSECRDVRPLYPINEDDEHERVSRLKLQIPKLPQSTLLDIPLLQNFGSNPESKALILYTPPKAVIEESIERGKAEKQREKAKENTTLRGNSPPPDQGDVMMLD